MPETNHTLRRWLAAAITTTAMAGSAEAQEPRPDVVLRYDGLVTRQTFKFKMNGTDQTKVVGGLGWQFPPSAVATVGFDAAPVTFCLDPLVPVVAGQEYGFTIDSFGRPRDFAGVKDDKAGKELADKRAKYVRELYAKHYAEVVKDADKSAAFQVAIWELTSETQVPVAPAAFSLYSGTFQAADPIAQAPGFVQTAEGYLKGLTGDDAAFAAAPLLAGRELVQLTGTNLLTGAVAQSQLAVRNRGGVNNLISPFGADSTSFGGLGGGGLAPIRGGFGGLGGLGGGFGGGGFGGGGFGGVPFVGTSTGTTTTSPPTTTSPGTSNPISPTSPPPTSPPGVPPVPPVPPTSPPPGSPPPPPGSPPPPPGSPPPPPESPPPPPPPPESVPAPPALLLGAIAVGVLGVRRVLRKPKAEEPPAAS